MQIETNAESSANGPSANDPKRLADLIDKNFRIPTIPIVASKALSAIADERTSVGRLASIVGQDQGLTTRLLSVANSVAYCPATQIKNLQQAAGMLGIETMKNLIIAASHRAAYKRFGPVEKGMWRHSIACGIAAQTIAAHRNLACKEEAFVAGLMHDVGRVVMNNGDPEKVAKCLAAVEAQGADHVAVEHELFGFTHAEVGALLINRWNLSEALYDAVLLHHDPESAEVLAEANVELCRVTYVADRLVHRAGLGAKPRCDGIDAGDDASEIALGLAAEDLEKIEKRVRTRFDSEQRSIAA